MCESSTNRRFTVFTHVAVVDREGPDLYPSKMLLTDEDVGRNVRDLRADRKMTQSALAGRVYLDRSAVSRMETGHRAVTVPELAAIADVLGVDLEYLAVPSLLRASTPGLCMTCERRIYVESARPRWTRIPAWRQGLSAAVYGFSTRMREVRTSLAGNAGLRRGRGAASALTIGVARVLFAALLGTALTGPPPPMRYPSASRGGVAISSHVAGTSGV